MVLLLTSQLPKSQAVIVSVYFGHVCVVNAEKRFKSVWQNTLNKMFCFHLFLKYVTYFIVFLLIFSFFFFHFIFFVGGGELKFLFTANILFPSSQFDVYYTRTSITRYCFLQTGLRWLLCLVTCVTLLITAWVLFSPSCVPTWIDVFWRECAENHLVVITCMSLHNSCSTHWQTRLTSCGVWRQ